MELSVNAKNKRRDDMQAVSKEADPSIVILTGLWCLICYHMAKLSPNQRHALAGITILAGGAAIGVLIYHNLVWLALVLVFVLGIAIAEIRRL